jgi:putative transposase
MATAPIRTYTYRIYPTAEQEATLRRFMAVCCDTWNAALEQRIIWSKDHNLILHSRAAWSPEDGYDWSLSQTKQLQEARRELELKLPSQMHYYVLFQMDIAFKRLKTHQRKGGRGGFPRFRAPGRWRTLVFPTHGQSYKWLGGTGRYRKIRLPGVGNVLVRLHRPLPNGDLGRATITELPSGRWMVGVCVRSLQKEPLPRTRKRIGISLGMDYLIGMSDGRLIEAFEFSSDVIQEVERSRASVSRTQPGSKRRTTAKRRLARAYERAIADRDRELGELARSLVDENDEIVLGNPGGLGDGGDRLATNAAVGQIAVHGWHILKRRLQDRCEMHDRILLLVDARDAHEVCPVCDSAANDGRDGQFSCAECGYGDVRDLAAAKVVLRRGDPGNGDGTLRRATER